MDLPCLYVEDFIHQQKQQYYLAVQNPARMLLSDVAVSTFPYFQSNGEVTN